MKRILLVIAFACSLRADSVTYSATTSAPLQHCEFFACQPFTLTVPQFDPSQGTLESVTWTLSDFQRYYGGFNDEGDTPGEIFSYTTTEGDRIFGQDLSNTQEVDAVTDGQHQISLGGGFSNNVINATGTTDSAAFIGQGTADITVLPFLFATQPNVGDVFAAITDISDIASLDVTYQFQPFAVPEPRGYAALFAGLVIAGLMRGRLSRRTREACLSENGQARD